jgi:hypothetical protein
MREAILKMIEIPETADIMGRNAFDHALAHHRPQHYLEQYIRVIKEAYEERNKGVSLDL